MCVSVYAEENTPVTQREAPVNLDIKWFCRLGIDRHVLTPDVCRNFITALGDDVELLTLAQAMLDNAVCDDFDTLQTLVDDACDHSQAGHTPELEELGELADSEDSADGEFQAPRQTQLMPVDRSKQEQAEPGGQTAQRTQVMATEHGAPQPRSEGADAAAADDAAAQLDADAGQTTPEDSELSLADLVKEAVEADVLSADPNIDLQFVEPEQEDEEPAPEPKPIAHPPEPEAPDFGTDLPDLSDIEDLSPEQATEVVKQLLSGARAAGASDVHLSAGAAPFMRLHGAVTLLTDTPLSAACAETLNAVLLDEELRQYFREEKDTTFALQLEDRSRYRVNLVQHKEGVAGTYHLVPKTIRTLEELGFSNHERIAELLDHHNGLILVTGPAGSGKTTTLAALVQHLNCKRYDHIITIEDPIEVLYASHRCFITQREIGSHTRSYASALKGALREDPDIIVIGELHDLETIEMAITAAETGHLVISTLHTRSAANTLNRVLDVFPPSQQPQIRAMTSESLRGVICQQLLPRDDGKGRVVASELYINTPAGANIIREGALHHLQGVMQTGVSEGMRSMDQSVSALYQQGTISEKTALENIRSREVLKRLQRPTDEGADSDTAAETPQGKGKNKKGWFK